MKSHNGIPLRTSIVYACGMMGWSIMINLIGVILIYLYLPPMNSGLPGLITQATVFGALNIVALITAGGRLVDAVYDPLVAQWSDASKSKHGRRIPFMRYSILPACLCCVLIFCPPVHAESSTNILWLALMLSGFYIASTTYIIPYNALLPQMATTAEEKISLSTWQSTGFVFGIAISSNAFNLAAWLQETYELSRIGAIQTMAFIFCAFAAMFMSVTAYMIREKDFADSEPVSVPLRKALRQTLGNKNFLLFIVADFAYFIGVTIITSGLMYFVTVLLDLPDTIGNKLMITMVLVSFVFYPVINKVAVRTGKKPLVVYSLLLLAVVFCGMTLLGKLPVSAEVQIYTLIIVAAIPLATLNILPGAILADIIQEDTQRTGTNKEAVYFAVRYFFIKIAQTFGIALFATLLLYGKDPGNDAGIRMNGLAGCILCFTAGIIFSRFKSRDKVNG